MRLGSDAYVRQAMPSPVGFLTAACLKDKAFMASSMPLQLFQSIPLYLSSYGHMFPLRSTFSPPSTFTSPFPMDLT